MPNATIPNIVTPISKNVDIIFCVIVVIKHIFAIIDIPIIINEMDINRSMDFSSLKPKLQPKGMGRTINLKAP